MIRGPLNETQNRAFLSFIGVFQISELLIYQPFCEWVFYDFRRLPVIWRYLVWLVASVQTQAKLYIRACLSWCFSQQLTRYKAFCSDCGYSCVVLALFLTYFWQTS